MYGAPPVTMELINRGLLPTRTLVGKKSGTSDLIYPGCGWNLETKDSPWFTAVHRRRGLVVTVGQSLWDTGFLFYFFVFFSFASSHRPMHRCYEFPDFFLRHIILLAIESGSSIDEGDLPRFAKAVNRGHPLQSSSGHQTCSTAAQTLIRRGRHRTNYVLTSRNPND